MADNFSSHTVAWAGSNDPAAPLVVLLHGRGADQADIVALADFLPDGPMYAAVRGPIHADIGYTWFENRGAGRPIVESLRSTMEWFRSWLEENAPAARSVLLIGFSAGAAFAGALILDQPERYLGAAILSGTLPFDAGIPVTPGRLSGKSMLVSQGEADQVIPRELLDRTWNYLIDDSGAETLTSKDPGGHNISLDALAALREWISTSLSFPATS